MNKFKAGDKVKVVDTNEEMLDKLNMALVLAAMFGSKERDIIEPEMVGTVVGEFDDDSVVVNFGTKFKGCSITGNGDGNCTLVIKELLEVINETAEHKVEEFKPYLLLNTDEPEIMGYIGEPTDLKTTKGNSLCIGDVVIVDGDMAVVVKDEDGVFFMGNKVPTFFGIIEYEPKSVIKKLSHDLPWDGDVLSHITYVRTEKTHKELVK